MGQTLTEATHHHQHPNETMTAAIHRDAKPGETMTQVQHRWAGTPQSGGSGQTPITLTVAGLAQDITVTDKVKVTWTATAGATHYMISDSAVPAPASKVTGTEWTSAVGQPGTTSTITIQACDAKSCGTKATLDVKIGATSDEPGYDLDGDGKEDDVIVDQGGVLVTEDDDSINIDTDGDEIADIVIPKTKKKK